MDTQRVFLAVILSLVILLGYQFLFVPPQPVNAPPAATSTGPAPETTANPLDPYIPTSPLNTAPNIPSAAFQHQGKDITVETPLYTAVISSAGGGFKSFKLKNYKEFMGEGSDNKELVTTTLPRELPLYFSWNTEPVDAVVPAYTADKEKIEVESGDNFLALNTTLPSGIEITRTMTFNADEYQIQLHVNIENTSEHQVQGAPYLSATNSPFGQSKKNQFLFQGPALFQNGVLEEIKPDSLRKDGPQVRTGQIDWVAFEDTYFMAGIMPANSSQQTVHLASADGIKVSTVLTSSPVIIPPGNQKQFEYTLFFGPKKLSTLQEVGSNLDKIVNFGWFDILAKPMLYLLNFLFGYVHNYGWAIILVTIVIKLLFWPIAHKGMKSMKTMQKIQPKMAKLREKYGDNKEALNREMIQLYKTYKVNPVGGCLPMLLQIPVFFALYKVLLQTIELRHAPFMLWITDLSAPDRLGIGINIPYLEGIPILTLLMGGSMYLQQKMTPTTGDPMQAKIMKFLPLIFIFMFLNFASGLVLYWFINNVLSIAQQYAINKSD
ncbi:MAG: membrane protein insertase YidC [Desulfobulbaceae bacterium]|uniref:Membrane protein insertase YidC n=1 Tax=Candidatus Desulfobia pelagia TaxID=2841692 RepID=A0A8J6NEY2_9BACT|nr:membrane protein insertase YidC [Candidatus Desulfobia pelagia]